MISHITLGSNDVARARVFYDKVLPILGLKLKSEGPDHFAYGRRGKLPPWIWVMTPFDGRPASVGNGAHVALIARTRAAVRDFHAAALAAGGSDEGAPGPRPQYGPHYYAAYVRDPDGNKLQAVCYKSE